MDRIAMVKLVAAGLRRKQLRTWLTVFGIVIGIAAIVALVSVGQGLGEYIGQQLNAMGTDYVNIQPGNLQDMLQGNPMTGATKSLTENDRKAIETVPVFETRPTPLPE